MITLEEAKELKPGDVLIDSQGKRWKVNGKVQRWVRDPDRIRVPLKHGLYAYDAITEADFIDSAAREERVCVSLTKEDYIET